MSWRRDFTWLETDPTAGQSPAAAAPPVKQRTENQAIAQSPGRANGISCTFKRPVMFHKMNVKNGSKDLKTYTQISRRVRDTLARLNLACAGQKGCDGRWFRHCCAERKSMWSNCEVREHACLGRAG